ncbi:ClbS/DfsB family four-helix bundle protein [Mesorhizobium sp.]|uniref:ClbS/DfsB family four-helix bundle protein n=1 Tax=Mesorhizobium sp. TaxID=1871066 RepID=UPI0012159470|nr:ClbS/DfsB family four-helix bundle protein [Mesorhizobium sp.]TIO07981.1 MAG: ClbS/DfsB family four-helix bundle protein [Mesorhizobium sp.]TIO37195.1 MAG: ClbS/DfsB family four-helix bundle protein [Mesorhizobium sp.]TIP14135.1 MAG: ClbS/DfsB family four-helix bundle protein [Mesorhizobium sp.]
MAIPQNKDELLKAINSNFEKLLKELNAVPAALVDECSMEGHAKGTLMSVSNLVAYLVGWNELVLKWLKKDAAGQPIDFPETGFKWNELGKLAQKFYRDYEGTAFPQLLERLGAAKGRIVSIIESRDNADLYERVWHDKWTMGRMIQFNTSSPYDNARGRLRTWLKAEGSPQKSCRACGKPPTPF